MGCINSSELAELKNDNVFRVVRLQPDSTAIRSGFLELNSRELIFASSQGREDVVWALQHLRRYGVSGDIFSFEAGRRCMSGPGIYTFRCQQAERLYHLFQRYVNAVSLVTDEAFVFADREHPSHTFGRPDLMNPHTNNYLEPAPIAGVALRATVHESFSSSPLSLELDSPDSVPSLSFTNEVIHFQSHHQSSSSAYANSTPNASSNVYLEHPLRSHTEHNNNSASAVGGGGSGSTFSTLTRKTIVKRSSLDVPPEECAPMLTPGYSDAMHAYANIEGLGTNKERDREKPSDPAERCYENLSRLDLPLLLQPPPSARERDRDPTTSREPATSSAVNYIVLDLDQPRSPAQCSPKTCFGSGLSLTGDRSSEGLDAMAVAAEQQLPPAMSIAAVTMTTTSKQEETVGSLQHTTESSLGYSTIDFIKTCALIKSSTHFDITGGDFDPDHDNEESRITRHSKKAYSISE